MKIDAVLPAGGRISGEFAREAGAEVKALIPIGGVTVLERMISSLRATGAVRRIVVIGPGEVANSPAATGADAILSEGSDSGPANILQGLEWLHQQDGNRHAERVLVMTSDLPLVSPDAITGFIDSCPADRDLCLPVVRRDEYEERFPDMPIEYVKLADGQWTIGCAFLINPEAILKNREVIERIFQARKSQLGMARLLGLSFIFKFLTGRLTGTDIEKRCLGMLGCSGAAVRQCSAELALDIDLPEEYRYAAAQLAAVEAR